MWVYYGIGWGFFAHCNSNQRTWVVTFLALEGGLSIAQWRYVSTDAVRDYHRVGHFLFADAMMA